MRLLTSSTPGTAQNKTTLSEQDFKLLPSALTLSRSPKYHIAAATISQIKAATVYYALSIFVSTTL